jgi:hypothetical protein
VQIPEVDVASGPGGASTGPNPGKGKGKAVAPVHSDNEVSLDDDHPLQWRRRLLRSDGFPVGGPPPTGQHVLVAVTMPRPDPSVAASSVMTPGGSDIVDDAVVVSRAAVEKEAVDAAATKMVTDNMTVDVSYAAPQVQNFQCSTSPRVFSRYHFYIFPRKDLYLV